MSISSHLSWKAADPEADLGTALSDLDLQMKELPSQDWDPATSTIGGVRDYQLCLFAPAKQEWSFLLLHLNSNLADKLATKLSLLTQAPTLALYEFHQSAWGFVLFESGEITARFCNDPLVIDEDPPDWTADPDVIARTFAIDSRLISPYLHQIGHGEGAPGKAFPDDRFSLEDHWVRCDFMRRLGMNYPDPEAPGSRYVHIYEPKVNTPI